MRRVCVFCGSAPGRKPDYEAAARVLGAELATRGIGLVYGAASIGVMGALADAVLSGGGEVIGVIPDVLMIREVVHPGLTELRVVRTLHERKALMADLSDAFLALPGGLGTLDELCEALTWAQLGIHSKPCALLNVCGYFDPLIAMLDRAMDDGFVKPASRALLRVDDDPRSLLDDLLGR